VVETTVKRLLYSGFRRTGKAMGQEYRCWWRKCREINVLFFQVRLSYVLRFISICDLLNDSLSYNSGIAEGILTKFFKDVVTFEDIKTLFEFFCEDYYQHFGRTKFWSGRVNMGVELGP
jgi:hypothetical protein